MCSQTVLRFCISPREIFSNSIAFTLINRYAKAAVIQISSVFGPFIMLLFEGSSEGDFLDIYLTTFFRVRNFQKRSAMRVIFFSKYSKFNLHLKSAKKKLEEGF